MSMQGELMVSEEVYVVLHNSMQGELTASDKRSLGDACM